MKCRACHERQSFSIEQGATLIKSRYLIVRPDGAIQVACKACGALGPLPSPAPRLGVKRRDH